MHHGINGFNRQKCTPCVWLVKKKTHTHSLPNVYKVLYPIIRIECGLLELFPLSIQTNDKRICKCLSSIEPPYIAIGFFDFGKFTLIKRNASEYILISASINISCHQQRIAFTAWIFRSSECDIDGINETDAAE